MTNVTHSTLTGADLHESKGVSSAAVNTVHVADGSGSGAYQKIPLAALSAGAKAFEAQLLHVTGSAHAIADFGLYQIGTTLANELTGISLALYQLTMPAGVYYLEGEASLSAAAGGATGIRLRNVSTSSTILSGLGQITTTGGTVQLSIKGRFTLLTTSVIALMHTGASATCNGSQFLIWKVS
jgi:hypothetical protein